MLNKELFIFVHTIGNSNFHNTCKDIVQSQWKTYSEIKKYPEKKLKHMINYAYDNVLYCYSIFKHLELSSNYIKKIDDLIKNPKRINNITKQKWDYLEPVNLGEMKYYTQTTGAFTRIPFKYILLKYDRFLSGALLYRGWGYTGYELGDQMEFLVRSSLDVGSSSFIAKKAHGISRNVCKLSVLGILHIDKLPSQAVSKLKNT